MDSSVRDDEATIRQLLDEYSDAIAAKDAETAHSYYADDLVCFDLAPPLCLSGERALDPKDLRTWLASWRGPIHTEGRDLHVAVGGDLAFAYGLRHMTGTKKSGEKVDVWFRATCGMRREKGEWKIFHLHNSVPFYMDGSARAALDLEP